MRVISICALLCLFGIGCGAKTGQIDQARNIIDSIEIAQAAASDKSQIEAVSEYTEEREDGIRVAVEDGKLSCNLVNADLRETLLKIADAAQLQFVFPENVYGRVNASFSNLELEEGVRLILDSAHYILEKKAGVYSVRKSPDAPSGVKHHEVQLRYITAEEMMERIAAFYGLSFELKQESAGTLAVRQSGSSGAEATIEMQYLAGPTSLKVKDVTIVKAINRNILLMSGDRSQIDEILELIAVLDQKVPQVLIETYLVEYDEEALRESGIDLSIELIHELSSLAFSKPIPVFSLPAIIEGTYKRVQEDKAANGDLSLQNGEVGINNDNDSAAIMAKIHSLIDENRLTIVSRPYVIVRNGAQAFVSAASEQYVIAAIPGE